jgi:hypothetical protein
LKDSNKERIRMVEEVKEEELPQKQEWRPLFAII